MAYEKPRRITGRAKPDPYDVQAQQRAEHAQAVVESIWVDTPAQRAILNAVRSYMRVCLASRGGQNRSLTGRRLSQFSQAGKSATAGRLAAELMEEDAAAGRTANPHRVVHVTIDPRMTLKMLYQEILNQLADDFADEPGGRGTQLPSARTAAVKGKPSDNIKILEQRVEEWVDRLGVELVVVDEVQRLATGTADAMDVTKKFQAFLDRGVVPLLFIGDETSEEFFEVNKKFAARLHKKLELRPLDVSKTSDRRRFSEFCRGYDQKIIDRKVAAVPSCLREPAILDALISASGGHIGRAARMIQIALPAALERGAVTVEAYDLSNVVRDFAMGLGWVDHDPFSIQPDQQSSEEGIPPEVANAD